jgi:hypothetical protein
MARGIPLGRFLVWLGLAAGWLAGRAVAADAPLTPNLRYELDYSTGIFWKVGGGATPLSYTLLPQIITLKIPPIHEWPCGDGTLVMRSRFSLLLEPILHGPEDYYLGLAAAGEVEWRDSSRRFTAFFASGGGFGFQSELADPLRCALPHERGLAMVAGALFPAHFQQGPEQGEPRAQRPRPDPQLVALVLKRIKREDAKTRRSEPRSFAAAHLRGQIPPGSTAGRGEPADRVTASGSRGRAGRCRSPGCRC